MLGFFIYDTNKGGVTENYMESERWEITWEMSYVTTESSDDVGITGKKSSHPLTSAEFVANQWALSIDAHQFFSETSLTSGGEY